MSWLTSIFFNFSINIKWNQVDPFSIRVTLLTQENCTNCGRISAPLIFQLVDVSFSTVQSRQTCWKLGWHFFIFESRVILSLKHRRFFKIRWVGSDILNLRCWLLVGQCGCVRASPSDFCVRNKLPNVKGNGRVELFWVIYCFSRWSEQVPGVFGLIVYIRFQFFFSSNWICASSQY